MSPRRPPPPARQNPARQNPARPDRSPRTPAPQGSPRPGAPRSGPAAARPGPARQGSAAPSRRPGSSRPPASSRPRTPPSRPGARGGTRAGTGRPIWVLGGVAVVLAVLILPYFQKWLVQRSQIESTRAQVAQSQGEVRQLSEQLRRWEDDEYVTAQARERLHYVMPGEEGYVVIDPKTAPPPADPGATAADVPVGNKPWYSEVWVSAQVAGQAAGARP
jgi:cell division protein FtsB